MCLKRVVGHFACCFLPCLAFFSFWQLCDGLTLEELEELQLEIKQYQELVGENG